MTRWIRRLINMFRREQLERELEAELESHLGLETDRNLRAGMPPAEARRLAHARLGGVEQVKERWREDRPFRWIGPGWLDVKLGLRMLVKHPALTVVAVFALAIGIPVGLVPAHVVKAVLEAPFPVDEGEQIQGLRNWNVATNRPDATTPGDLTRWRDELTTFEGLGAWRESTYNVHSQDGLAAPVGFPAKLIHHLG